MTAFGIVLTICKNDDRISAQSTASVAIDHFTECIVSLRIAINVKGVHFKMGERGPARRDIRFSRAGINPSAEHTGKRVCYVCPRRRMHLTSAQRVGEFKPGDARVMTLAAWALAHGLATLMLDDQLPRDIPAERLTRACAALLLDGMRRQA